MHEVACLVDVNGDPFWWYLPENRSSVAIRDHRPLWDVIWENKHRILGIAHTHPEDCNTPSNEDLTTFDGIESGLGKRLTWWVVTRSRLTEIHYADSGKSACCASTYFAHAPTVRPWWTRDLWLLSTSVIQVGSKVEIRSLGHWAYMQTGYATSFCPETGCWIIECADGSPPVRDSDLRVIA